MLINDWLSSFSNSVFRKRNTLSRLSSRGGRSARARRQLRSFGQPCLIATQPERLEDRTLLSAKNPFELSSLLEADGGTGETGFVINGVAAQESSGRAVQSAGDVNGDGLDDLLIGARFANQPGLTLTGATYLVFGTVEGTQAALELSSLDGTAGFVFRGTARDDQSGIDISGAGDVNGDGFDDLIIGAAYADPNGEKSGASYLVFGGRLNLVALDDVTSSGGTAGDGVINLADLDGQASFVFNGIATGDHAGYSVSGAGDVNGDGFDDLLIGAPFASPRAISSGASYVVFGGTSNLTALDSITSTGGSVGDGSINLADLDGVTGFTLTGTDLSDTSGFDVSSAGDVNGDGLGDLLIGSLVSDLSHLVFGGMSNLSALDAMTTNGGVAGDGQLALSDVDGLAGFAFNGLQESNTGISVSGAGDIDGDGFDDLLIGAPHPVAGGPIAGTSYLIFGGLSKLAALDAVTSTGGTPDDGRVNLVDVDGITGFVLNGTTGFFSTDGRASGDYSGTSVSGAGDVNGDGFDDLLIGAYGAVPNGPYSGASYVLFGGASSLTSLDAETVSGGTANDGRINLVDVDGDTGFVLNGSESGDYSGRAVSSAGDVNGDGFDDLLIGAFGADPNGAYSGSSYVVFGGNFTGGTETQVGTSDQDTLTGTAADDVLIGGRGSDLLQGKGGADVLIGGHGFDEFEISSSTFKRIDGGTGRDTLRLDGSGITLDLTTLSDNRLTNIETIDITGSGDNTLTLDLQEVLNICTASNLLVPDGTGRHTILPQGRVLTVMRNYGDTVNFGEGWTQQADLVRGIRYDIYTQGAATLRIQSPEFELSSLLAENGEIGFSLAGVAKFDQTGLSVQSAGDVNGDGLDDLLIGAFSANSRFNFGRVDVGVTYLVFGTIEGSHTSVSLGSLNGTSGFILIGDEAGDLSGRSVSGVGDVNGDGFDDLLIGAFGADSNGLSNSGETFLIFGGVENLSTLDSVTSSGGIERDGRINLADVDGTTGFVLNGSAEMDRSGFAVNGAGDVNGDGFEDLVIGAYQADPNGDFSGQSYLVFGGSANLSVLDGLTGSGGIAGDGRINLADLDGATGFVLNGVFADDRSGRAVSSAGDVNGDGFDDLVVGAPYADPNGLANSGSSYLIFGGKALLSQLDNVTASGGTTGDGRINLADLDGTTGFILNGIAASDASGIAVSSAGDVNGDGFSDLLIGASFASTSGVSTVGESYLVYGGLSHLSALDGMTGSGGVAGDGRINLADLNGDDGFAFLGTARGGNSGRSVSGIGDSNGDGFDDILIGAFKANSNGGESGTSYLVFGGPINLSALDAATSHGGIVDDGRINLAELDNTSGVQINGVAGRDFSGIAVSGAGDLNGDGLSDLLIGASGASFDSLHLREGGAYLLFGGNFASSMEPQVGTPLADTLAGTSEADALVGGRGPDLLIGNGGNDVLSGGEGADILAVSDSTFARINGGNGLDTVRVDGGNVTIDLTSIHDTLIIDIEAIDLRGSGANTLTLDFQEVINISSSSNTLSVRHDSGDTINIGNGWVQTSRRTVDSIAFNVFTQGVAELLIEDITPKVSQTLTLPDGGGDYAVVISESGLAQEVRQIQPSASVLLTVPIEEAGDLTIIGSSDADRVTLSDLDGYGGTIIFAGNGGDDLFDASAASQVTRFLGGAGDDTFLGGTGSDRFNGGSGADSGAGGAGDDTLVGNSGDDTLAGDDGDDLVNGKAGRDVLTGNAGNDTVLGGGGTDTLDGGDGADFVNGQGGQADIVAGGGGDDTLRGGPSDVTVPGSAGSVPATPVSPGDGSTLDITLPETGGTFTVLIDELQLKVTSSSETIVDVPVQSISDVSIIGSSGDDNVILDASLGTLIGSVTFNGGAGGDSFDTSALSLLTLFVGGAGNDLLTGGGGQDIFNGGDGDDSASGGVGDDILNGGNGNDLLVGDDGNDLLNGNGGQDSLFGEDGDDTLLGGRDTDLLDGGDGNDAVNGQGGTGDTVAGGGGGTDTVRGDSSDTLTDGRSGFGAASSLDGRLTGVLGVPGVVTGSTINGVLHMALPTSVIDDHIVLLREGKILVLPPQLLLTLSLDSLLPVNVPLADVTDIIINGNLNNNAVIFDQSMSIFEGTVTFNGGAGNDFLDVSLISANVFFNGGVGDDTLIGGGGNDVVNGGAGNDSLSAGAGTDLVRAGAGNDLVEAGAGDDTIFGDEGDDVLLGGAGNDILNGNGGSDTINGEDGDDKLLGGADADSLDGGLGDDTVRGQGGDLDIALGGGGIDLVVP